MESLGSSENPWNKQRDCTVRNLAVKKGMKQVMGGRVLTLKSDRMIKKAQEQSLIGVFLRCVGEMGMSRQEAQRIAGISDKLAEKALTGDTAGNGSPV